jgi:uncharacterized protein YbjT (DUF2867 family)
MTDNNTQRPLILVTGATGYVGGRLVPRLLEMGYRVRCLVRDPARLQGRPWSRAVEVAAGDVLQPQNLAPLLQGVSSAYYLIHSMKGGSNYSDRDLNAAENFSVAAHLAGVERIIYLGGLAKDDTDLSEHLRSRRLTGEALRSGGVPVTEFQAGVVVGSGSLSFEIIRYLTERLPVMICPRWVYSRAQPIGIRDVLDYLVCALDVPESCGRIIQIGGSDVITYAEMMMLYAEVRGLKRRMFPVPVLTPQFSSYWLHFVTPIPVTVARPLIEGLKNENIVTDRSAQEIFPEIQPAGYRVSVERALTRLQASNVETAWTDALSTSQGDVPGFIMTNQEGMVIEHRQRVIAASPEVVYKVFMGIGGQRGWYYMNWAWELRGFIDRLFGGVGMRRSRRDPDGLRVGDALDFWRVEAVEPNKLIRLRAEMKVPGKAWLQFQLVRRKDGKILFSQTAFFAPKGMLGWLYWYSLYPFHRLIFSGLADQIAQRSLRSQEKQDAGSGAL